jgi:hypothetical protein
VFPFPPEVVSLEGLPPLLLFFPPPLVLLSLVELDDPDFPELLFAVIKIFLIDIFYTLKHASFFRLTFNITEWVPYLFIMYYLCPL